MKTDALDRYGMDWVDRWREISAAAPVVPVIGRQCTCTFLLGFGANEYIINVVEGRVSQISMIDPHLGDSPNWQFAIRGPTSLWDKFLTKDQPAGCIDIWGMNYAPAHPNGEVLVVEGDVLPVRQHNRCLQNVLDLLRSIETRD